MATPLSQMEILAVLIKHRRCDILGNIFCSLLSIYGEVPEIFDSEIALDHCLVDGVDRHPREVATQCLCKQS